MSVFLLSLHLFWGCPSLRLGRAIAQLAARSALQRLRRFGLPPAAALLQPLSLLSADKSTANRGAV
ncbi:hypothetical protein SGRA_3711 [Saprospira grandis str. Lewin]|uniref:Uncharacterized protein n=1 Tax=Saprospira grandis (strain Lewin) TaxID=984262 RepID=H6L6Z7_SAPGL|nr:hypothetical protein SGRA_3711 [Saprospira grandis str. Lewin]